MQNAVPLRVQLGSFELDMKAGELRKNGLQVRLQEQPFQILLMLVERSGQLVTLDEIKKKLWPNDTVVEFDHSIHTAIKKLRQALDDSASSPKYIETVARRGYRLIVPVECLELTPGDTPSNDAASSSDGGGAAVQMQRVPACLARESRTTACWKSSAAVAWVWCIKPRTLNLAAGRPEVPAGRAGLGPGGSATLRAGSAYRLLTEPSQHLHDLRIRGARRSALHGDGIAGGRYSARSTWLQ